MDREKVIKGLHDARRYLEDKEWSDRGASPHIDAINDAIALLKEQEAVEPKTGHWIYRKYDDMFMCSSCEKYSIRNNYPYCHWCGVKMKQEGQ